MQLKLLLTALIFGLVCSLLSAPVLAQQSLVLAVGGEPENGFDPVRGWGHYGHPLFQSTLLRLDAELAVEGDLATDWVLSGDGLVWTLTLRQDARFSDGSPVTAEDVVFTFEQTAQAGGLVDLTVLEHATAVDKHTVELHLQEPKITFTRQLTTLGIVPKDRYDDTYARNPIGSGPYRLVEWREGAQLVVEPNPYWHGGELAFARISFLFTGEDAAFAMAHAGQIDLLAVPPVLAQSKISGMSLVSIDTVDNRGIAFPVVAEGLMEREDGRPVGNNVTADIAVRRSINRALDREELIALALDGHGQPAFGPADGLPWGNPEAAYRGVDVEAAVAGLESAGWHLNARGVRERDGVEARFTLLYPAGDSTRQALALGVADQLGRIGIKVDPSGRSWSDIDEDMHASPVVLGWGAHDPLEIWNLYHSSGAGVDYFNTGYYRSTAVDQLFAAAQRASSLKDSLSYWQAAEWNGQTGFGAKGDAAWAWLVNLEHMYFANDCLDLGDLQPHPHGHGFPITAGIAHWQWVCD